MTQFEKTAPGALITQRGATRIGRYTLMYLGIIVLIGTIALVATLAFQLDRASAPASGPRADQLVDGWMPGVTAANAAARLEAANRQRDGYMSSLFPEAPEVTDGWASALLKDEPAIVDGWASRYLVDDED